MGCVYLFKLVFLYFSDIYLGVEWLGHMVLVLVFWEASSCANLHSHQQCMRVGPYCLFYYYYYFVFSGLHLQCMEVPRLGIELELLPLAYTTAHGNARSLTHWARSGIKPMSSWMLVRFVSAEARWELPKYIHFKGGFCCIPLSFSSIYFVISTVVSSLAPLVI